MDWDNYLLLSAMGGGSINDTAGSSETSFPKRDHWPAWV